MKCRNPHFSMFVKHGRKYFEHYCHVLQPLFTLVAIMLTIFYSQY